MAIDKLFLDPHTETYDNRDEVEWPAGEITITPGFVILANRGDSDDYYESDVAFYEADAVVPGDGHHIHFTSHYDGDFGTWTGDANPYIVVDPTIYDLEDSGFADCELIGDIETFRDANTGEYPVNIYSSRQRILGGDLAEGAVNRQQSHTSLPHKHTHLGIGFWCENSVYVTGAGGAIDCNASHCNLHIKLRLSDSVGYYGKIETNEGDAIALVRPDGTWSVDDKGNRNFTIITNFHPGNHVVWVPDLVAGVPQVTGSFVQYDPNNKNGTGYDTIRLGLHDADEGRPTINDDINVDVIDIGRVSKHLSPSKHQFFFQSWSNGPYRVTDEHLDTGAVTRRTGHDHNSWRHHWHDLRHRFVSTAKHGTGGSAYFTATFQVELTNGRNSGDLETHDGDILYHFDRPGGGSDVVGSCFVQGGDLIIVNVGSETAAYHSKSDPTTIITLLPGVFSAAPHDAVLGVDSAIDIVIIGRASTARDHNTRQLYLRNPEVGSTPVAGSGIDTHATGRGQLHPSNPSRQIWQGVKMWVKGVATVLTVDYVVVVMLLDDAATPATLVDESHTPVLDADGSAISWTYSGLYAFGLVPVGTGAIFLYNGRSTDDPDGGVISDGTRSINPGDVGWVSAFNSNYIYNTDAHIMAVLSKKPDPKDGKYKLRGWHHGLHKAQGGNIGTGAVFRDHFRGSEDVAGNDTADGSGRYKDVSAVLTVRDSVNTGIGISGDIELHSLSSRVSIAEDTTNNRINFDFDGSGLGGTTYTDADPINIIGTVIHLKYNTSLGLDIGGNLGVDEGHSFDFAGFQGVLNGTLDCNSQTLLNAILSGASLSAALDCGNQALDHVSHIGFEGDIAIISGQGGGGTAAVATGGPYTGNGYVQLRIDGTLRNMLFT